jgi:hypothetical protein
MGLSPAALKSVSDFLLRSAYDFDDVCTVLVVKKL